MANGDIIISTMNDLPGYEIQHPCGAAIVTRCRETARHTIQIMECFKLRHPMFRIGAVMAALFLVSCTHKGNFSLVNKTNERIVHAWVTICGQTIELTDIQPSKVASDSYEVKSDSHYTIQVEFQSGRKLQREMGYVTNGMDFWHEIVVTDSDIEITDSKAR